MMHSNIKIKSKRPRRARSIQGYEIRIEGHLEEVDGERLGEVTIANQAGGEALLSGSIPDQAALMRVLLDLHHLGITILSVKARKRSRKD
jgi:hypothetical protein